MSIIRFLTAKIPSSFKQQFIAYLGGKLAVHFQLITSEKQDADRFYAQLNEIKEKGNPISYQTSSDSLGFRQGWGKLVILEMSERKSPDAIEYTIAGDFENEMKPIETEP